MAAALSSMDSGHSSGSDHSCGSSHRLPDFGNELLAHDLSVLGSGMQLAWNGCTSFNRGQPRPRSDSVEVVMDTDRRTILSLVAAGRITAGEAERLLAAWNDSRETAWILVLCLMLACLAQFRLHELLTQLLHFINAQIPVLTEAVHRALSPINELVGGLL